MESLVSLLPIIAIFGIFWLLMIRPATRRQKAMAEMQRQLEVGDKVLTQSGIIGTIDHFDDDKIGLEIAPGVIIAVIRPAVVGQVTETPAESEADQASDTSLDEDR